MRLSVMTAQVEWHGTTQESTDLVNAIAHNCTCEFGLMGVRQKTCLAHEAMTHDQHWLDWLIYLRRYYQSHGGDAEP